MISTNYIFLEFEGELIFIGLILFLTYFIYKKSKKTISNYFEDVLGNWVVPSISLFFFTFFCLIFVCGLIQIFFFLSSIIIWGILLTVAPFLFLPIVNKKLYNFLSEITLFIIVAYSIALTTQVDKSRKVIAEKFISNYDLYYSSKIIETEYGDEDISIMHIKTGNNYLDFVIGSNFSYFYRTLIWLILMYSIYININLRNKNKLIRSQSLKI